MAISTLWCNFPDILKVRDFAVDYVGCYKDQKKAYSSWLSGFVDTIYTYQHQTKRNSLHIYKVRGSLTVLLFHILWILVQKDPLILICWCSCIAGIIQSCNHVRDCQQITLSFEGTSYEKIIWKKDLYNVCF